MDSEYPDNKLTGATFEVYKDSNATGKLDDGDELLGALTEKEIGEYGMNDLFYGRYFVKETKAPEGFVLDTGVYEVMIDTNGKGLFCVPRVIAPKMVAAGRGHIFNIGSIAGTEPYENGAVYCASKHAVHAISQSMRADLLAAGVKVTEIRPGMVETEFSLVRFHGDREAADRVYDGVEPLTGDDIAEAIAWAAQLPAHMNVNDMVLMPTQQAGAYYTYRKNR